MDWTTGFSESNAPTITALIGDVLSFEWSGNHNVYQMASRDAMENCDFSGATQICHSANSASGNDCTYTIAELPVYFSCDKYGHCEGNQVLVVKEGKNQIISKAKLQVKKYQCFAMFFLKCSQLE